MIMRNRLAPSIVILLLGLSPSPAAACVMPPPVPRLSGETDAQYEGRMAARERQRVEDEKGRRKSEQIWWFDTAREIVVAQVVEIGTREVAGYESPLVTLETRRWLRGSGTQRRFALSFTDWSSCGPSGGGDAPRWGRLGELFVIYDIGSSASARGELNVAAPNVLDPRVRTLLAEGSDPPAG
jgi:hypothetical protein